MHDLHNWAGNQTYSASLLKQVSSEAAIRSHIERGGPFKVLGTRHCFNTIADSRHQFLSLSSMDRVIDLDRTNLTVTVETGIRYGDLAVYLDKQGYALHNLASMPHISVAGGVATATHGSGVGNGSLSTAVAALEMITADGSTVKWTKDHAPEFNGVVVHLGALGVVTKLTLAIEPAFTVSQRVFENLPVVLLQQYFIQIMSSGYSVSLFTDWRSSFINEVWIKSREGEQLYDQAYPTFYDAAAATKDLHPIRGLGAENCTKQMSIPGPWHERLPHFRMGFTPSSGAELQSEYFVPIDRAYEAILEIGRLAEKIAPHLLISEIRCVAADEHWMSPCYQQQSAAIHFTWKPEWEAVRQLLPLIEAQLAPLGAKPHWGKLFTMDHCTLMKVYPKLADFQQLVSKYDPAGMFRNDFLQQLLFGRV